MTTFESSIILEAAGAVLKIVLACRETELTQIRETLWAQSYKTFRRLFRRLTQSN